MQHLRMIQPKQCTAKENHLHQRFWINRNQRQHEWSKLFIFTRRIGWHSNEKKQWPNTTIFWINRFWHWVFGNNSIFQKIARPIIALAIFFTAVVGGWTLGVTLTADPVVAGVIGIAVFTDAEVIIVDQIWKQMDTC